MEERRDMVLPVEFVSRFRVILDNNILRSRRDEKTNAGNYAKWRESKMSPVAPIGESEDPRGFVIEDLEASNPNYASAWKVFLLIHTMMMMRGTMMINAFFIMLYTSIAIGCVDTLDQGPAGVGALAEMILSN